MSASKSDLQCKKTGVVPPQLQKNLDWVRYVMTDAQLNGWPSFVTRPSKTDKLSGEKIIEEILMSESAQGEDGMHVFADTGSSLSYGQAMCYAKVLRDSEDALYASFSEEYDALMGLSMKPSEVKVVTVTKTSAQVEKEKALLKEQRRWDREWEKSVQRKQKMLKKVERDAQKAAMNAAAAAEKQTQKQAKALLREQCLAEKEAEKQAKALLREQTQFEKAVAKQEERMAKLAVKAVKTAVKTAVKAVKTAEKVQKMHEKQSKMATMLDMAKLRSTLHECVPGEHECVPGEHECVPGEHECIPGEVEFDSDSDLDSVSASDFGLSDLDSVFEDE